jgi:hypothetical protein
MEKIGNQKIWSYLSEVILFLIAMRSSANFVRGLRTFRQYCGPFICYRSMLQPEVYNC